MMLCENKEGWADEDSVRTVDSNKGDWIKVEAVAGSGSVEHMAGKQHVDESTIRETNAS